MIILQKQSTFVPSGTTLLETFINNNSLHFIMSKRRVVEQARSLGLTLVTLPSHTSHSLQPLDIACSKSFGSAFRHCRDIWSLANKGCAHKQELAHWVFISLKRALTPTNIFTRFRSDLASDLATRKGGKMSPSDCWPSETTERGDGKVDAHVN